MDGEFTLVSTSKQQLSSRLHGRIRHTRLNAGKTEFSRVYMRFRQVLSAWDVFVDPLLMLMGEVDLSDVRVIYTAY